MTRSLVDNAADPQQVKRAGKVTKRRRVRRDADLRAVMGTRPGRAVLWRVLSVAGVFELSYTGEALGTAFHEGQRNIGLALFADLHRVCPDLYTIMADEAGRSDEDGPVDPTDDEDDHV